MRLLYSYLLVFCSVVLFCNALGAKNIKVIPAAENYKEYIHILEGQRIGLVANQTSIVNNIHLVDFLISKGVWLSKIFSPEHGFRGKADAGAIVNNSIDKKTSLPVFSLYGKTKKPTKKSLANIDLMVFDIQDVGVRFYTYISTLHYVMEACAENNIPLLVLDRPNPNAFYIDGPVLEKQYQSFVGMHPVPVVYGMSIGEYALMINGEGWLNKGIMCDLQIVKIKNWTHNTLYNLPILPSPNLPNARSILLYPSLCFFEGTKVSVGRGTDFPFQCFGHPDFDDLPISFKPRSIIGASIRPKLLNTVCRGKSLRYNDDFSIVEKQELNLSYILYAYKHVGNKKTFFTPFFNLLAGNKTFKYQIRNSICEKEIRDSWEHDIVCFKSIRAKYLLYK